VSLRRVNTDEQQKKGYSLAEQKDRRALLEFFKKIDGVSNVGLVKGWQYVSNLDLNKINCFTRLYKEIPNNQCFELGSFMPVNLFSWHRRCD
jgi:hypothetical protein